MFQISWMSICKLQGFVSSETSDKIGAKTNILSKHFVWKQLGVILNISKRYFRNFLHIQDSNLCLRIMVDWFWSKLKSNKHDFVVSRATPTQELEQEEDNLCTHQYLAHDMEPKHPMSWYKHVQPLLPSSQAGMQLNQHKCHCSMLGKRKWKESRLGTTYKFKLWTWTRVLCSNMSWTPWDTKMLLHGHTMNHCVNKCAQWNMNSDISVGLCACVLVWRNHRELLSII